MVCRVCTTRCLLVFCAVNVFVTHVDLYSHINDFRRVCWMKSVYLWCNVVGKVATYPLDFAIRCYIYVHCLLLVDCFTEMKTKNMQYK